MSGNNSFYADSLGKKAVMAVSGIVLFGFVLVHMLGNLKMYLGPDHYNHYAAWLREVGTPALPESGLLWIFRVVLLAAVGLHMLSAWQVTRQSWSARPQRYSKKNYVQADYAARTMRWGGVIIAFFVAYHLLHLTWGTVHPGFQHPEVMADGTTRYFTYSNVVSGFSQWPVALIYMVANVILGFHLYHGLWSLFQTMGWNHPRFNAWRRHFATAFAFIVTAGNVSFPIAVLTGIVS
jgi:succinate dehydrogenase / fumarate reductase cytochrome b subunit